MTKTATGGHLILSGITPVGRRSVVSGVASLAAGTKFGMPYIGNAAAADPIKIGMIWAKTGFFVDQAEYLARGRLLGVVHDEAMIAAQ
jgi:hypothetical protein